MKNFWLTSIFLVAIVYPTLGAEKVEVIRTPNSGIQPQAVIDDLGTLHLIYFKGDPESGNLLYVKRDSHKSEWSDAVRVNSEEGSARRNGAISHAQLAIGQDGRLHVTWFNMRPPKYYYTRTWDDGPGFEQQRDLVTEHIRGVEAGASVAADANGNVYVVWHAGAFSEENQRGVYMVRSHDSGKTFGPETRIDDRRGVCACCGLSALWNDEGALYVSYRAATDFVERDMTLLKSIDGGESFVGKTIHKWNLNACPVSTTRVALGSKTRTLVAWETKGQVFLTEAGADKNFHIIEAPEVPSERRKNPAVAMNEHGEVMLAWGDGPGWRSGGVLHWQVFDAKGNATRIKGRGEVMPEFSVPAAVATPDGTFVLIY